MGDHVPSSRKILGKNKYQRPGKTCDNWNATANTKKSIGGSYNNEQTRAFFFSPQKRKEKKSFYDGPKL